MPGNCWRNERPQSRQRLLRTCRSRMPRRKPQSSCRTVLRHQPLFRRREPPQCGHDIGPVYRADIVIVPPLRSMSLISYWGRPKTISESVKTLSPKIVLPIWDQGLPPFLIKSRCSNSLPIPCLFLAYSSHRFPILASGVPRDRRQILRNFRRRST